MYYSCFLALVCILAFSEAISICLKKGINSNVNLCKNSPPKYKVPARSAIECFAICLTMLGNTCINFKYHGKDCSLYDDVIRFDFNEFADGSCRGYQMSDCPVGFKYLNKGNKCIKMMVGYWDWYAGRQLCNSIHPFSHPVIIDSAKDFQLFTSYLTSEIIPKCQNKAVSYLYSFWSAGISPYVNGKREQFQWIPFPGVFKPLNSTTPWISGEPTSYSYSYDNCIQAVYDWGGLDDYDCLFQNCVLCEIDMNI